MASVPANKFVADTHVWISFFYGNRLEKILLKCIEKNILFVSCNEQLKEFTSVYHYPAIKEKKLLPQPIDIYDELINNAAEFFEPQKRFALLFDYKDNYLVDLANQTGSKLITNDRGFRILKKLSHPKVESISLKEFYALLEL